MGFREIWGVYNKIHVSKINFGGVLNKRMVRLWKNRAPFED
jgi:hypothetical protein